MLPEQRRRTRGTSRPVDNVIREKRPQFRQERSLLVPAYRLMNHSGQSLLRETTLSHRIPSIGSEAGPRTSLLQRNAR